MNSLFTDAKDLQLFCNNNGWNFCFIGGLAVLKLGEPRLTRDVDISLLTGYGNEKIYIDTLLKQYRSRIENPAEFALDNRVLLLKTSNNFGIDVALAALPFEELVIDRAIVVNFGKNFDFKICTAEDLIIYKAFANRSRDWLDIETILQKQTPVTLDWEYITTHLQPLSEVKNDSNIMNHLELLRVKCLE